MDKKKVLFVVGSLREGSFNRQLANQTAELMQDAMDVSWLDFRNLPLMNQDIESPVPEEVQKARQAFLDADGVWFFTPEYNGMIPGGEKNLLDWMSRPLVPGDVKSGTALRGRKVTASGCGGRFATSRVREQLNQLLKNCMADVMTEPQTGVWVPPEAMKSGDWTIPDEVKEELKAQGDAFLAFMA